MPTIYHSWFGQGQYDYMRGLLLDENPSNDMNSEQYQGWRDGWIKANEIMREAKRYINKTK